MKKGTCAMKKLLVVGLLVVAGVWVCGNTKFGRKVSAAVRDSVCWVRSQVSDCDGANAQRAVPKTAAEREREIKEIRKQITKLENNFVKLLDPIAERQAEVNRLDREVKTARANHKQMREDLLALTQKVEAGVQPISIDETPYTLDEAKAKLHSDFSLFKDADASLKSREQLLSAQKENLRLARQQLTKIREQQRQFEVRLVQLETTEEHLKLQQIATPLRLDQGDVAAIKNRLDALQHGQDIEKERRVLQGQFLPRPGRPAAVPGAPAVSPQEIRNFLSAPAATGAPKVVSSK